MMRHEDIRAELPLYVLGSLDADEREAIARHLDGGCDECAREFATWREVVGMMPLEIHDAAAPDLKARLLARVRRPGANVTRRRLVWTLPLAAAATVLLALAVVREAGWRADRAAREERIAGLERTVAAAQVDFDRMSVALAERERDVAALRAAWAKAEEALSIVQGRGLNVIALKETKDAPPAEGHVLLSLPAGRALFYAFDLAPVPADKTYELWWITEKEGPVMAGLFRPDERGLGRLEASVPTTAGSITAAAVTVEAAGGVPKPQGPMVLLGPVAARS